MPASVVTRCSEVTGYSVIDDGVVGPSVMVTNVAAVERLGVNRALLVTVGRGLIIDELATVVRLEGFSIDVARIVCAITLLDSESVIDLSAVTDDNSDTVGSLLVNDWTVFDVENILIEEMG